MNAYEKPFQLLLKRKEITIGAFVTLTFLGLIFKDSLKSLLLARWGNTHNGFLKSSTSTGRNAFKGQLTFPLRCVNIGENPDFVGRDAELEELYRMACSPLRYLRPASCVIHGFGGMGKTQTGLKFTYQFREQYEAIFWVSADPEHETEMLRTFVAIGRKLQLFDTDEVDDSKIAPILEWLQNTERRWLLVFDNVVDWNVVSKYWPTRCKGQSAIIVTSQKQVNWTDHHLPLLPLNDDTGSKFLLQNYSASTGDDNESIEQAAAKISAELGGFPLYLSHARGHMRLSGCTLQELRKSALSGMILGGEAATEKAISATHDLILKELSPEALDLLYMLSFMNADDIGEDLLLCKHNSKGLRFLSDEAKYKSLVGELERGNLVQRETTGERIYLCMHRSTQRAMLQKMKNNLQQRQEAFLRVLDLLREHFRPPSKLQIAEAHIWPLILKVLPHLQSLVSAYENSYPKIQGTFLFAQLMSEVGGMDLYDRGRTSEAYKLCTMVEAVLDDQCYELEEPLRGDALTIVGLCTDVMNVGKRIEGLQVREKCLKVRQLCYEAIDPDDVTIEDNIRLYNSYTDLVCSQQQFNDFSKVRENCEKCLEQYKSWGAENVYPYEYAKYYNHMAYVYLYEGDIETAISYAEKGYILAETATPGAQLAVLYKFDWACILFQAGRVKEALAEHKQILKIRQRECGEENVRTLESRLNVGIIEYFAGDLDSAEKQIRRTLDMTDLGLWPEENVVRARYYLSQILRKRDSSDKEAATIERDAKASLDHLLREEGSGKANEYAGNYPILFDYIVPWECRLVTPRKAR